MEVWMHYLERAAREGASDVFLVPGAPVSYKLEGKLQPMGEVRVMPEQSKTYIEEIYRLAERDISDFLTSGDDDFSFSVPGLARFRVNVYRQRGSWAAVIRVVQFSVPDYKELGIPEQVMALADRTDGMVLVSGIAGCGKSTTLACLIDRINRNRACHIVTLEDPIEYLHRNQKSIVSQREVAVDTSDYLSALRSCLRQAPDVIQLGEMRDLETIRTAMTAAETGHLLLATLHTKGAVNTIDRIVDAFPADQQQQIRIQLSMVLRTVVSQQLLPGMDGSLVPAFEILQVNSAVRSMIRDSRNHLIPGAIAAGGSEGMISMDQSILELYRSGRITRETALGYCDNPEQLERRIDG
jgi:twitching motility protein PilT